ncbi:MAG TPA: MFS transporter [Ktedonobacteraceae bacterium]|nr:MFS transporter [Ktedonobacteraceae bacterium]
MSIAFSYRLPFARALHSRPFALLWTGQTISALGDGAFVTALSWQALQLTGSAMAMGMVVLAQTLPMILLLLLGGVVADRFPRQQVLLWSDASRAVAVLLIAALGMLHLLQLGHLVLLALFFGTVRGFFSPAYQSIIPQLVSKGDLPSANSLTELSYQLYCSLGPMLGASCVAFAGPAAAFAFDGLTFIVSALCLFVLRLPVTLSPTTIASAHLRRRGIRAAASEMREGLRYVAGSTFLWVTIALSALCTVGGAGSLVVALPKLIHDVYGQGVWLLGAVHAAGGIGSLLALLLAGQLNRLRRRGITMYLMMIGISMAFILFGLPLPHNLEPEIACLAMVVVNFGLAIYQILWLTVMQEIVPGDRLGRVSSIDQLGGYGLWPVGFVLAGVIADYLSPSWVFIGAGIVNTLLYSLGLSIRAVRQLR